MPFSIPGAPPAVVAALEALKDELTRVAGANFAGLVLYGGLARGQFRPGKSDVNVVVLLNDASGDALTAIAPALRTAWRAAAVEPMILTPDEIAWATDAFPTKFLDIKNHHLLLAGVNPLATLEVDRERIRIRIEQELRNMLMRLRRRFLASLDNAAMLTQALTESARPLALQLESLLQYAGKPVPAEDRSAAIFSAAVDAFGLERAPLARLAELRHQSAPAGDAAQLFREVLHAVTRAATVVQQMKEPTR